MGDSACVLRLQKELRSLSKEPVSHVHARPSPSNILEWHFVLEGSPGTPFQGGFYHGKLKFSPSYPFKPPSIMMITPSGRFATNTKICMSMSDYHPESWNPMWSVASILNGLLSFMMENSPTMGSLSTSAEEKQKLAKSSLEFNCSNAIFCDMFPDYVQKLNDLKKRSECLITTVPAVNAESENRIQPEPESSIQSSNGIHPVDQVASTSSTQGPKSKTKSKSKSVKLPIWLTALIVAFFASVMALPLLTIDFS